MVSPSTTALVSPVLTPVDMVSGLEQKAQILSVSTAALTRLPLSDFQTFLVKDACRGISASLMEERIKEMEDVGVKVISSKEVPLTSEAGVQQ